MLSLRAKRLGGSPGAPASNQNRNAASPAAPAAHRVVVNFWKFLRWGRGAVGSAPRWHRGGRGFESHRLHQLSHTKHARAAILCSGRLLPARRRREAGASPVTKPVEHPPFQGELAAGSFRLFLWPLQHAGWLLDGPVLSTLPKSAPIPVARAGGLRWRAERRGGSLPLRECGPKPHLHTPPGSQSLRFKPFRIISPRDRSHILSPCGNLIFR